jgi:uncharacterized protein (TIGR03790 family)
LRLLWPICLTAALLVASCSGGGGGGSTAPTVDALPPAGPSLKAADLAVLIAEGDPTSEAIGRAYQAARGIPDAHMIRVTVPGVGSADTITSAAFATLKSSADAKLPATAQATLVTWTRPSRVVGPTCSMGITSALAWGYDARFCGGCAATARSAYYNSDSARPFADLGLRPSMMLGASTVAAAQTLINRGVAADGVLVRGGQTGQAWLVRTSDAARSVRFNDMLLLSQQQVPGLQMRYVDNAAGLASNTVSGQNDIMLYQTGLATVADITSNRYLPGAVADHLTSTSGVLGAVGGQMPITDWLAAGATGSYGTVEEPCNIVDKFPQSTVLIQRYVKGETLIEAYWKSVAMPGQGLFVGEPLARPWGR